MISIIVPAHDEGRVIERCLRHLTEGAERGELEVIVVSNGCSDDTGERARAFSGPIRVIDVPIASKSNALNVGDGAASGFPRFYVDADVIVPLASVRAVAQALRSGDVLAAAPRAEIDLRETSWAVRAFYRVWTGLPYFDDGMVGAGVYALSEEGRARFEHFPDIIADDEFLRRQFASGERRRVNSCTFTIVPPKRLRGVVDVKTRSRLGLVQLEREYPGLTVNDGKSRAGNLGRILRQPRLWPSVPIYLLVGIATRFRALKRAAAGQFGTWDRDESSRAGVAR